MNEAAISSWSDALKPHRAKCIKTNKKLTLSDTSRRFMERETLFHRPRGGKQDQIFTMQKVDPFSVFHIGWDSFRNGVYAITH